MRAWLNDLPIPVKLWIFNVLTALIAGVVSAVLLILIVWRVEYGEAQRDAEIKAAIIAENALPALQFRDNRTADEILAGLARDGAVLDARIVEANGQVFARFTPPDDSGQRDVSEDTLQVAVPMSAGGERLATLEVISDTTTVSDQIVTYIAALGLATAVALIVGSFIVVRLQRAITDPLAELTHLMGEVSGSRDLSRRARVPNRDELGQLSDSFNRMIDQIDQRNTALGLELAERLRAEERLEHLAHHDPVTGLPNRHFFRKRTGDLTRGKALAEGSMALLFVDLDNFKYINDTFGHDCGDQLLVAVAERLLACVRAHDMVVRFGGDEFVVLLDRIGDSAQAQRLGEKLLETIVRPFDLADACFYVTCSIGVAVAPEHAANFDELLRKSDAAMYVAKAAGKNAVRLWEPSISDESSARFMLELDLRKALAHGELAMHYQPIVALDTGRIAGMEALMRWHHPTRGFVSPAEFIPIAEDTGLILELGEWAMREAFSQAAQWNARFGPLFVAVNVSGRQFRDREFASKAESIARASGLARDMSELEVTESIIMGHTEEAVHLLEDLSARGFALALDDFGTGYSSLSYLKRFPLDKLKIDRSFVKDLPDDLEDAAIAEAIVGLARTLSMRVVAEGIETEAQAQVLRELGCQYGQGYFFSKPLAAELMAAFIAENHGQRMAEPGLGTSCAASCA
ncbi:putative bifunctional diguanylate cyclase/phosphodiesterase [Aromatoleum diolicum]|uniref:EAL domain-containing protein n=1 Tax=Aromatoleum diolicum TaxID=75796 RepID=A0ABX1QG08_9RHOO|nr:EAL domain-containing protein [Aromatoleum diolicum]NMG77377.1 EAL domain-containing protein [Aromatoleum diolicum]